MHELERDKIKLHQLKTLVQSMTGGMPEGSGKRRGQILLIIMDITDTLHCLAEQAVGGSLDGPQSKALLDHLNVSRTSLNAVCRLHDIPQAFPGNNHTPN